MEESQPTSQLETEKQAFAEFQVFKSQVEQDLEDARLKIDESNSRQLRDLRAQLQRDKERQVQLLEARCDTRLKERAFDVAK